MKNTRKGDVEIRVLPGDPAEEQTFTLEDAFDFATVPEAGDDAQNVFDCERAIRAVGFLLHFCSETGSGDESRIVADGLGFILDLTANDFARAQRHARKAKG